MKTLLALLSLALLAAFACAATHYVDIYGGAQYTQVQPAIDAPSAGDSIVVFPGGYQGFNVDRRLTIIGVGTGTGSNEASRIDGIVTIMGTADSTELQGLWIIASVTSSTDSSAAILRIRSGASGVFVWRCFLENTSSSGYLSCVFLGSQSSAQFTQCTAKAYLGVWTLCSGWRLSLASCVFGTDGASIFASSGQGMIEADHCVMTSVGYVYNCLLYFQSGDHDYTGHFENSAFLSQGGANWNYLGSVVLNHCAANGTPPGYGNIICSAADFVNLAYYNNPPLQ